MSIVFGEYTKQVMSSASTFCKFQTDEALLKQQSNFSQFLKNTTTVTHCASNHSDLLQNKNKPTTSKAMELNK